MPYLWLPLCSGSWPCLPCSSEGGTLFHYFAGLSQEIDFIISASSVPLDYANNSLLGESMLLTTVWGVPLGVKWGEAKKELGFKLIFGKPFRSVGGWWTISCELGWTRCLKPVAQSIQKTWSLLLAGFIGTLMSRSPPDTFYRLVPWFTHEVIAGSWSTILWNTITSSLKVFQSQWVLHWYILKCRSLLLHSP